MNRTITAYGVGLCLAWLVVATPCSTETVTYRYDALGRLVSAVHSDMPSGNGNDGMSMSSIYDQDGNRSTYQISGSKGLGPRQGILVIVPLNGYTAIPIGQ